MKKFLSILAGILILNACTALPCFAIKIGLQTNVDRAGVGSATPAIIIDANTNRKVCDLEEMVSYEIRAYKNKMAIKIDGKFYKIDSDNIVIKPIDSGFVSTKNKWYRGYFIIQNKNQKLTLINDVDIEDYVKGVVPAEMPPSWNIEAHKAQAVAARSYALANLGKRAARGYDLKDTPEDQAYSGASAETPRTNQAVDDTEGIVLIYDLKIIPAYYYASAGGQTSSASSAWGKDLPYIRSVPSYDGNVRKNGHGVGMSQHGANNLAKQGYNAYQILQYFYKNIKFARIDNNYYN